MFSYPIGALRLSAPLRLDTACKLHTDASHGHLHPVTHTSPLYSVQLRGMSASRDSPFACPQLSHLLLLLLVLLLLLLLLLCTSSFIVSSTAHLNGVCSMSNSLLCLSMQIHCRLMSIATIYE